MYVGILVNANAFERLEIINAGHLADLSEHDALCARRSFPRAETTQKQDKIGSPSLPRHRARHHTSGRNEEAMGRKQEEESAPSSRGVYANASNSHALP